MTTAINEPLVLNTARATGHFWDQSYPDVLNVNLSSFDKLKIRDRVARDAIASMQRADLNFEALVWDQHKRAPIYDGEVGPATMKLVEGWTTKGSPLARCPIPDFAPPPNATFHYDDPDLQAAVESMQRAAAEPPITGPYWRGCDSQRPGVHSLVIGIDIKNAPSVFLQNQEKILAARIACAAEIGVAVRFVINPTSLDGLQQLQVYKGIGGSTIGLNYFPSSNSCGRIPNGSMDSGYNPSNWQLHACLGCHESEGHGFGFNHTRGGIMNPSILLVWPLSWKGDTGWSQVTQYYPAKPLVDPTPPPPPPPPDDFGVTFGDLVATNSKGVSKVFSVVPKGTKPGPNPFPG